MTDTIEVKLTTTNFLTRWPCHVCGGSTEKVEVLAEVLDGDHKGLRVCEQCLKAGNIDERLQRFADGLEAQAAATRALIGRIKVPTWEQYTEAIRQAEEAA